MLTRRSLLAAASTAALRSKNAKAAFAIFQTTGNEGAPAQTWSELKIGPGGLVRQGQVADDGTVVCCCDTNGAYVGKPSTMVGVGGTTKWNYLINSNAVPGSFATYANSTFYTGGAKPNGVWEIGIAPGNSQVLGMMAGGLVFISTNQGGTWVQASGITQDTTEFSNGLPFCTSCAIAFDPANEAICYVGHSQQGVWKTTTATNGSAGTWSQISTGTLPISSVKANSCGLVVVKCDRSGGTLSSPTRTKNIYIFIYGQGVYKSTDGGSTWALTTSSPTTLTMIDVGRDGYVYGCTYGSTTINIYNGTTWATQTGSASGNGIAFIAADPNTNGRVVTIGYDGSQSIGTSHGTSWTAATQTNANWLTATDVPWLQDASTLTSAGVGYTDTWSGVFDPSQSNVMLNFYGLGVMVNTPAAGAPTFTSIGEGIEQLVCNDLICPPSGTPIALSWDRPIIKSVGFGAATFPSVYAPHNSDASISNFSQGIQADWASDGSGTVIVLGPTSSALGGPGFVSANYGATWVAFPTQPFTTFGGAIACASATTWLALDPATGKVWLTTNSGTSWAQATGLPTTNWAASQQPGGTYAESLCADRVTANKFYAYNFNGSVYSGTVSGSAIAFSAVGTAPQTNGAANYYMRFKTAPGKAGHVFISSWNQGTLSPPGFSKSTDGGATWAAPNSNLQTVYAFDFGATKGGTSYPSIWAWGSYSNAIGLYVSTDGGATWTHVVDTTWGNWPSGDLDFVTALCTSKDTYGWVAIGFQGSGYHQGYFPV